MSDVFISYKSEDWEQADWLRRTLEQNGVSCWMAPTSIPGGSSYAAEIPVAIRECRAFVLVLSARAQTSRWVPRELDQAINAGKVVLPFMLENCALRDDFNFYLTNVQRYEAYENKAAALRKLLRDLRALLGPELPDPEPEPEPAPPPQPKPARPPRPARKPGARRGCGRWLAAAAGALVLVVLLGAAVRWLLSVPVAGMRYDRNERVIHMSGRTLTEQDWNNLGKLTELQYLTLIDCTLPAGELGGVLPAGLQRLELENCGLTQAQYESLAVAEMPLYMLNLSGNPQVSELGDLSALAGSLTHLDVSGTGLQDLSALEGFTGLMNLCADGVPVENLDVLQSCEKLQWLYLDGCALTDLTGLRGCPALEELRVNGNRLESLEGLENCLRLQTLQAENNRLTSLTGLENATRLDTVCLGGNQLPDVTALSKSAAYLRLVRLADNQLTELSALAGCTALEGLDIDRNQVDSLAPLAESRKLRGLSARDNRIGSTEGIEGLDTLEWLDLGGNPVTRVGVEAALTFTPAKKAVLDLTGAQLEQVDLQAAGGFRLLSLRDAAAADWGFVYGQTGGRLVVAWSEALDLAAIRDAGYTECVLLGCPADRQLDAGDTLDPCRLTLAPLGEEVRDTGEYPYF